MQGEGDSDYRWRGLEQEVGLVLVLDLAISPLILQCVFNHQLQVSCAEATLSVTVLLLTCMMCMICPASRPRSSGRCVARECAVICGQCGETHRPNLVFNKFQLPPLPDCLPPRGPNHVYGIGVLAVTAAMSLAAPLAGPRSVKQAGPRSVKQVADAEQAPPPTSASRTGGVVPVTWLLQQHGRALRSRWDYSSISSSHLIGH